MHDQQSRLWSFRQFTIRLLAKIKCYLGLQPDNSVKKDSIRDHCIDPTKNIPTLSMKVRLIVLLCLFSILVALILLGIQIITGSFLIPLLLSLLIFTTGKYLQNRK